MKFFVSLVIIILLILSCPATIQSKDKDKNAPLPPRVLSAVTVYVDNQTASGELQNVA